MKTLKKMHCSDHIRRLKRHCPHKQCYPWSKWPTLWFFEENSSALWKAVWKPAGTQYSLFPCSTPTESMRMPFTREDIAYNLCSSFNTYPLLFSNNILCPNNILQHSSRCLAWFRLSFVCFCFYFLQCLYCLPYDGLNRFSLTWRYFNMVIWKDQLMSYLFKRFSLFTIINYKLCKIQ